MRAGWGVVMALGVLGASATQAQTASDPSIKGDVLSLFGPDKYPAEARKANEQGRVVAVLTVSPRGDVTDCHITESSKSVSLDATTCAQLKTPGLFAPARDAKGRAVRGFYALPVRWVLPEAVTPLWNERMEFMLTIAPDGKPLSCEPRTSLGGTMTDRGFCPDMARSFVGLVTTKTGAPPAQAFDAVMTLDTIVEGDPPLPVPAASDMIALNDRTETFLVMPDGKPVNCRAVGQPNTVVWPCNSEIRYPTSDVIREVKRVQRMAYRPPSATAK